MHVDGLADACRYSFSIIASDSEDKINSDQCGSVETSTPVSFFNMSPQGSLLLFRGPVLIFGVLVSILWPYISKWSTQFILHFILASVGILWFTSDLLQFTKTKIRETISKVIDKFVLDDFLKSLYDPDMGIIPCAVGSCVGASSMYGLRLNDEQKTQLVQASLWTTQQEARSILLDAGGTKALLPQSIQEWLDEGNQRETRIEIKPQDVFAETVEEAASDSSMSDEDESPKNSDFEARGNLKRVNDRAANNIKKKSREGTQRRPRKVSFENEEEESSQLQIPPGIPTDPVAVLFSILRDMAIEKMRPLFASIPDSKVEVVGAVAAMGLCAQMLLRWRSNRSTLGSISALCLTGATVGAFSTVLLRHAILGSVYDIKSLKIVSAATLSRSLERIKQVLCDNNKKRWRGTLALIILGIIGRKRAIREPASQIPVPR